MSQTKNYRIISTSPSFGKFVSEPIDFLHENGCDLSLLPDLKTEEDIVNSIHDVDALLVGFEPVTPNVIAAGSKLKVVAKHGVGVDNIDVAAATEAGIVVINAPGANSTAVAELTFGLFLALARSIPLADQMVRNKQWSRIVGTELSGKNLGIIGLGQIGEKLAMKATAFGMKVIAFDAFRNFDDPALAGIELTELEQVLQKADFLSLHVPLNSKTKGMIGVKELNRMKKSAFLVNNSRGGIVDEKALYEALRDKQIQGAALDVFEIEPPLGNPLLGLDNVISTPHMAGYTTEALNETGMVCAKGIFNILSGKIAENMVNPEVLKR